MCGIAGIWYSDPERTVEAKLIRGMTASLYHRGPDEDGHWQNGNVALGMRRLSIIDLAGGHQPIFNEDRTCCIVYNGELYNFPDLRPELEAKGHVFATNSDTEVVLHAYEEWGVDCLRRFNGMFAFAIWDGRARRLFLARDGIGEKPLYYYQGRDALIFASEIKSILTVPVPREISFRGLSNFLAFGHAAAPYTIYEDIRKLLPGHYLVAENGAIRTAPYWDVSGIPAVPAASSEHEYAEQIVSLLDDSVRRRLIADVPVGAFLSGGVDSSAVVALMRRYGPVQTFSLGFTVGGAYNELADARQVAKQLGTNHHELLVEHVDLVKTLRTLVYHYDEPFGDAAGFPVFLLSRFAREHVKVVLAGDGGDELFGGYRRYAADQLAHWYGYLPKVVTRQMVPGLVDRLPRLRRVKRMAHTLVESDPARRYANWLVVFTPAMQAELLNPSAAVPDHDPAWLYPRYYQTLNGHTDHLNRLLYTDLKSWLPDMYLEKVDKATMACSLEARLPILDHRLVELAFQIPGSLKVRGLSTKRIFKRAVSSLIPPDVLKRRKHGFAVPTDPWFRGELRDFTFEVLLDNRARQRGYFNMPVIERLWREHREGQHVWDTQLWLLLNLELWHRLYIDGEAV